jgi:hypothetical protein
VCCALCAVCRVPCAVLRVVLRAVPYNNNNNNNNNNNSAVLRVVLRAVPYITTLRCRVRCCVWCAVQLGEPGRGL